MNETLKERVAPVVRPLLREIDFRAMLGGNSERSFKQLRADGIINPPLELGSRTARWTHEDFLETLTKLPRRRPVPEPGTLNAGRRARIERMKFGSMNKVP